MQNIKSKISMANDVLKTYSDYEMQKIQKCQ